MIKKELTWFLFLIFLLSNSVFSQRFITVDIDTHELIGDVDYSLYNRKNLVFKGVTLDDQLTKLNKDIVFDSISFSRVDYETRGFLKTDLDSVIYLSKKIIYLDELVIGAKEDNEIVFGEKNRFVKRQSRPLNKDLVWGMMIVNDQHTKLKVDKLIFYVNNITYRTAYKINFSEVKETTPAIGYQFAEEGKLFYSSDTFFLNPEDDKNVLVHFPFGLVLPPGKPLMVWIQLVDYNDHQGVQFTPGEKEVTKVKFQLSKHFSFYSKMTDFYTGQLSSGLVNVNIMINYDFTTKFFKKPHKSSLVTPSILMYTTKVE